jgi:hypothetical protein
MTRILLGVLLLAAIGGAHAARTMQYVEGAYELALSDVQLPSTTNSALTFKSCASCSPVSLTVNGATEYRLGDQPLPLPELNATVAALRSGAGKDSAAVAVYYDLGSKRVTRVVVVPPPAL